MSPRSIIVKCSFKPSNLFGWTVFLSAPGGENFCDMVPVFISQNILTNTQLTIATAPGNAIEVGDMQGRA
jgi:hypothetical protein